MNVPRIVSDIMWVFHKRHNRLNRIPEYRRASESLADAKRRGCTQDVHRARKELRQTVLDDLRRV